MRFRHVLFYEYKKVNNAASAFKNICATYGDGSFSEREWNFNLSNESTSELAEASGISNLTVHYNFKKMEMLNSYDVRVLNILTKKHLLTRVTACVSLLERHKEMSFLNCIVAEDEEWMWYEKEGDHCQVNPVQLSRKLDFIERRSYCAFGGIVEDTSIMNYYQRMKLLTRRSTVNN